MPIFPSTYNLWFAQYEVRATSSTLQWHMMQYFSQRKNDRECMPVFVITGKQLALQWRIYAGNFLLFIDIFDGIFITSYRNSDILMKEYSSLFLWILLPTYNIKWYSGIWKYKSTLTYQTVKIKIYFQIN